MLRRGAYLVGFLFLAGACLPGWSGDVFRTARAQNVLIVDGDFEANESGKQLRNRDEPPGWYESRGDTKEGRKLLMLSTKKIGGNATRKAMIKASPQFNTYLSQRLAAPQSGRFSLQYDLYVREILPPFNRSCFQLLGNDAVRKRGPNATGAERFVFLACENSQTPDRINLIAFEGGDDVAWDTPTPVVSGLEIKKWHTIRVDVDVAGQSYLVSVPGVTAAPVRIKAFKPKGKATLDAITHVSFASWNDGPGTFYVDNVR
jgi:hypothetical protein